MKVTVDGFLPRSISVSSFIQNERLKQTSCKLFHPSQKLMEFSHHRGVTAARFGYGIGWWTIKSIFTLWITINCIYKTIDLDIYGFNTLHQVKNLFTCRTCAFLRNNQAYSKRTVSFCSNERFVYRYCFILKKKDM